MENNALTIKVYDIDYEFIIKNYLDRSLWHKEWTLFVYKDVTFTIEMRKIDVFDESICFHVNLKSPNNNYSTYESVWYYMKQMSIKILKQQIEGAMYRCIEFLENNLIVREYGYKYISDQRWAEEEQLRDIASAFLDDNNVTNDEIRDVYIDSYVSNNSKVTDWLIEYKNTRKYLAYPDLYLVFLDVIKNDTRKQTIITKISAYTDELDNILSEVETYLKQLEEQDEELINSLEDELVAI